MGAAGKWTRFFRSPEAHVTNVLIFKMWSNGINRIDHERNPMTFIVGIEDLKLISREKVWEESNFIYYCHQALF